MPTSIADFSDTLRALPLSALVHESLIETRDVAIQQQKAQMFAGLNNDETPILPPYQIITIKNKKRKGQPFDRVTGYDGGFMYDDMFDQIEENTFTIASTSLTFDPFSLRYPKAFGLGPTAMNNLRNATEPILINKVRNYLGV